MTAILWVGRMLFAPDLRIREVEIARRIAHKTPVFALDRTEAVTVSDNSFIARLAMRRKLAFSRTRVIEQGQVTRFAMPVWPATGPLFNWWAAACNNRRVASAVERFGCGHVFHGNPFFFLPPKPERRRYRVHFDVIDNFYDEWATGIVGRSRRKFLQEAMRRADTLSACSHSLCDYAHRLTGRHAAYAPNGAARANLLDCTPEKAKAVRDRLGLAGRFVVGFIGNHRMAFDGMEMLLDAWLNARASRPDLALLVVGPGSDRVAGPRGLGPPEGVHCVGPVAPDDVPAYIHACDAGVHPYVPRPVTEDATPLNVVEFSTCGKPMLCNPLRELKRLAWPNLRFAEANPAAWAAALADPATFGPFDKDALQDAVATFDWSRTVDVIRKEMGL
ncbi:MAG: glycosyltransferase [Planctomycetes bacterium]|nr:glycosyltransferase [Planctomycetota bacterium]